MPKIARKRRFKHRKDHDRGAAKRAAKATQVEEAEDDSSTSDCQSASTECATPNVDVGTCVGEQCENSSSFIFKTPVCEAATSPDDDDSSSSACDSVSSSISGASSSTFKIPYCDSDSSSSCSSTQDVNLQDVLPDFMRDVKLKVELFLHEKCVCLLRGDGLEILFLSRSEDSVTQRQLNFSPDGTFNLRVHCKPYPVDNIVKNVMPVKRLSSPSAVNYFVDRIVEVVNFIRRYEICTGVDISDYKDIWSKCDRGEVDNNPYKELRYTETMRSVSCDRLVNPRRRRCVDCSRLVPILERKHEMALKEDVHPNTPNVCLTEPQMLTKLEEERRELDNTKRRLQRLKIQKLIEKEGVKVDTTVSDDFRRVLQSLNLQKLMEDKKITPQQAFFLEQQLLALSAKSPRGRRWHPTMIRFALSIFYKSPSAYGAMYESGLMTLPCRRTLFDYTHFKPVKDGIHYEVLESVAKRVEGMKLYQRYHVLMCDEMYISKNLVYEKSTGRIIGYVSLDDVQVEMDALNAFMENPQAEPGRPALASKILTFLIKGVSSNVKEAIATYGVDTLTKEQLYRWSWDVIGKCERSGIAIAAYVSDGSPINRVFIKMNKPFSTDTDVIYDTINKAAPESVLNKENNKERILYFIADVPHLIKTIRNCFLSSSNKRYLHKRSGKNLLRRRLEKNGQKIVWSTIVKLYHYQKDKILRKAYKLNAQNVFVNNYSKMRVKYAAEVLSATVAQLLEDLQWESTEETVIFIRKVNDFFDMLNGAHSQQGVKKNNSNLYSYCSVSDERFKKLQDFLLYLQEWKDDATAAAKKTHNESVQVGNPDDPNDVTGVDLQEENEENEEQDPASVRQLSHQTIEGIKITIHGFTGAVKFLLKEGVQFINARVFCQDPIEQYFSKQRSRGGGSTNPNFHLSLQNTRAIHVQGTLGVKRNYRGNTEVNNQCMTITNEPLPKKARKASKKNNS